MDGGKLYIQVLQRNETFEFQGFPKGTPGKDMTGYILAVDPATGKDVWKQLRKRNTCRSGISGSLQLACFHHAWRQASDADFRW